MSDKERIGLVITGLDWDDEEDPAGNVQHIARHSITPWEVREVLEGAPVFYRVPADGPNPVFVAVGPTATGWLLEVWGSYFEQPPKRGWWRTITAMDARPPQRARWHIERGGSRWHYATGLKPETCRWMPNPSPVRVELRDERVTIRLSIEEMRAIDREARTLGVGRSTLIRMLIRQGLGLQRHEKATTDPTR